MVFWFPTARRVSCRYANSRQKYLIAFADQSCHEIEELAGAEEFSTPDASERNVRWYRQGEEFYRRIFFEGKPASADQIAYASPHMLFYGWDLPTSLKWQDHPCARNVTFEPQLVSPIAEITGEVRFRLGNQTSAEDLDGDQAVLIRDLGIDRCRSVGGELVQTAPAPSMLITNDGKVRLFVAGIDTPDAYSIHFGLGQERAAEEFYKAAFYKEAKFTGSDPYWPEHALGESAARDTLISALSVLMAALARVPVGQASLDELNLIIDARRALTHSVGYSCEGVLWAFADCLAYSNNAKLRKLAHCLDLRRQVLDEPDEGFSILI